jgi:hypothetical protein
MSRASGLTPGQLRVMLREHALIVAPGELLVVMVPPDWPPRDVRELNDALSAWCDDLVTGSGIKVLVVPGTAVTVAQMPADPFASD